MMQKGNIRTGNIFNAKVEELLGERGPKDKQAVRYGELQEAVDAALIVADRRSRLEARKAAAAARSIYGISSTPVADVLVNSSRNQANPLTILSDSVAGFEDGGFIATFEGYTDNTHVSNSFSTIIMSINGVEVARTKTGVRSPDADMSGMFPFALTGVFNTPNVTPTVTVIAYATEWNDETTTTAGYYIRQGRLVISGGQ